MTDLNPMWDALARYQPYADADGHGDSWRVMCEERTEAAAWAAAWEAAAWEAATAAWAAAAYWSGIAIERIEVAIKERNHEATPPQRQPLTDEQITEILGDNYLAAVRHQLVLLIRATEAMHGIGGDK